MNPTRSSTIGSLLSGGSPSPSDLLDALAKCGLERVGLLASTPQDPEWHAEGNVRIHTEMVISEAYKIAEASEGAHLNISDRASLILSAALHDIGKTSTTREDLRDGKIHIVSPRHARIGRSYLATRLPSIDLPSPIGEAILGCVGHHHDLKSLVRRDAPAHQYAKLSRSVNLHLVYLLELADLRGRISPDIAPLLEDLELFRISAEEIGTWGTDTYADWKERIASTLPPGSKPCAIRYAYLESRRAYENGLIATPEEGVARSYAWCAEGQHAKLVLTCGTAGSGKSTWIRSHLPHYEIISLDSLREEIAGKRDNQSKNGQVFQRAKELLKDALRRKAKVVWDATSLRSDGRSLVLGLGHDYHAQTQIVAFPTSPTIASRQNRNRTHPIPTSILDRQLDSLEWPFIWEAHDLIFADQ